MISAETLPIPSPSITSDLMEYKTKVLIVDDEPDILEFLHYNLSRNGYEVIQAINGLDAVKIADLETPDLILLDIMMPGMDGVETCYELRKNPKLRNTIITFLIHVFVI